MLWHQLHISLMHFDVNIRMKNAGSSSAMWRCRDVLMGVWFAGSSYCKGRLYNRMYLYPRSSCSILAHISVCNKHNAEWSCSVSHQGIKMDRYECQLILKIIFCSCFTSACDRFTFTVAPFFSARAASLFNILVRLPADWWLTGAARQGAQPRLEVTSISLHLNLNTVLLHSGKGRLYSAIPFSSA